MRANSAERGEDLGGNPGAKPVTAAVVHPRRTVAQVGNIPIMHERRSGYFSYSTGPRPLPLIRERKSDWPKGIHNVDTLLM